MTLWLGKLQVDIIHAGRGHTKGDTIVWLPEERTLFSGDLVEYGATPYAATRTTRTGPRPCRSCATSGPRRWCRAAATR